MLNTTRFVPFPIMSAEFADFNMSDGLDQFEPFIILSQFLSPDAASGLDSMYSKTVLSFIKWILTNQRYNLVA